MVKTLDKKIQKKQWLKIIIFGVIILAILSVVGYFVRSSSQSAEYRNAMGTERMSFAEKESVRSIDGIIDVHHWVTDAGVRVYYVYSPNLPMVDLQVTFDAGSARDGNKSGLAYLTNTLLVEGTKTLNANQIAEQFESVGAEFSNSVHRDMAMVHVRSLTEIDIIAPAMHLLSKILSEPTFPEQGFKREQQKALQVLQYESQHPKQVAEKKFYSVIYQDQPYANWPHGTEQTLTQITLDDIRGFHKQYYVAQNAIVTIVGAVEVNAAHALAEAVTMGLPVGEKPEVIPAINPLAGKMAKVNFPSEQTHIVLGMPVLRRDDVDYFPLYVGNHILGGNGSVTRLFKAVRDEKGLAYDVHSYFIPMREQGPYIIGCQTKKDSANEALEVIQNTVKTFIDTGPTLEELEDAKRNLLGGFALRFDSNEAITNHVAVLGFYGLPLDYYDKYKNAIQKVTLDSIKDTYQRRIALDKMAVIMVGAG